MTATGLVAQTIPIAHAASYIVSCCPERCPRWPDNLKFPLMKASVAGKPDEYFAHVVSTVSFAELGLINTRRPIDDGLPRF